MRYFFNNKDQTKDIRVRINGTKSALLPMMSPINRNIIKKYGLFDSKFIATLYEADFLLRLINDGYKIKYTDIKVQEKKELETASKISSTYLKYDLRTLKKIWCKKLDTKFFFQKKKKF